MREGAANCRGQGRHLGLFGGLAPRYLVDSVPDGLPTHLGTTDLDVVIGIAIEGDDDQVYTKLQRELTNSDFKRGRAPARGHEWSRNVDGIHVILEFFCPVEPGGEAGKLKRNPGGSAGSKISAYQLKGAEIVGLDSSSQILSGDLLDYGGHRDRPASAAEAAAQSPIVSNPYVAEAMALLTERFNDPQAQGPSNYARFFLGGRTDADEERAQHRRYAHGTIQRFLARWHELRPVA